ncbi:MAG: hypothetical protein EBU90_15310 [Proteobacteria bacterium]|nr:hypothetical protein [Pseudomonadota bacterium]
MLNKINNGDLVYHIFKTKCGIVVCSKPSNSYPSKHVENVSESYHLNHYVLFEDLIEGPFLSSELSKVS